MGDQLESLEQRISAYTATHATQTDTADLTDMQKRLMRLKQQVRDRGSDHDDELRELRNEKLQTECKLHAAQKDCEQYKQQIGEKEAALAANQPRRWNTLVRTTRAAHVQSGRLFDVD